jgi:hypothetical protein
MRHVRFIPLAFLAGSVGFALFAPYATLVLLVVYWHERRKSAAPVPAVA